MTSNGQTKSIDQIADTLPYSNRNTHFFRRLHAELLVAFTTLAHGHGAMLAVHCTNWAGRLMGRMIMRATGAVQSIRDMMRAQHTPKDWTRCRNTCMDG